MSLKRLVLIIMVASLLVACGKSDNETVSSDHSTTSANTESIPADILASLPPEPAPEINNATLSGVDSDGDGVRDDVQRTIVLRFYQEPNKMNALLQQARGYQLIMSTMQTDKNKGRLVESTYIISKGFMCSINFFGMNDPGIDEASDQNYNVKKLSINTKSRILANIEGSKLLDGFFFHDTDISIKSCDFQIL